MDITPDLIDSVDAKGIVTYTLPAQTATVSVEDLTAQAKQDADDVATLAQGLTNAQNEVAQFQSNLDAAKAQAEKSQALVDAVQPKHEAAVQAAMPVEATNPVLGEKIIPNLPALG